MNKEKKKNWAFKRPTIMIDWDDVIVDTLPTLLKEYSEITGESIDLSDIKCWDLSLVCNMHIVNKIFHDPAFWKILPEKKEAFTVIQRLINDGRYDIFICTACGTKQEFDMKYDILESHIPGFNMSKIISIKDKAKFRADLIVDDSLSNLDACSPFMNCIVMDMPHNHDCDYQRIHSLNELPTLLEETFYCE